MLFDIKGAWPNTRRITGPWLVSMENILYVLVLLRLPCKEVKAGIYSVSFRKTSKKENYLNAGIKNHRQIKWNKKSVTYVWKGEQL